MGECWGRLLYCPVVVSANERIKPDYVIVGQEQERHTEGSDYISRTRRRENPMPKIEITPAACERIEEHADTSGIDIETAAGRAINRWMDSIGDLVIAHLDEKVKARFLASSNPAFVSRKNEAYRDTHGEGAASDRIRPSSYRLCTFSTTERNL
jgi:hypothetical protein